MQIIEHYGIVLPDLDPLEQGRYKVYIPATMQRPSGEVVDGIWCQNGLTTFRAYRNSDNQPVVGGNSRPITPGAPVIVSMSDSGDNPTIVRFAPTNISTPDGKNRDSLYIIEQTPKGSSVIIDEDKGFLHINYGAGSSNVLLTPDTVSLEINTPDSTGSSFVSGVRIQPDAIRLQMKDSLLELNSSGFGVTLKDGSYMRMTKKGIEFYGEDYINMASKKSISAYSNGINITGTSNLDLRSSDTKLSGTQKLALTGNQISIESFLTTQLKGMHIGLQAKLKMSMSSTMYDNKVLGVRNDFSAVHNENAQTKVGVYSMQSISSSTILQDGQVISNMGVGASVSASVATSTVASVEATQAGLAAYGTVLLSNNSFSAAASNVVAETLPGVAQVADEPIGTNFGVQDKTDKKSATSVVNSVNNKRNEALAKYSIVPSAMTIGNIRSLSYRF